MKTIVNTILDFIFIELMQYFYRIYYKIIHYRLRKAKGKAIISMIKNKGKDVRIHGDCVFLNHKNLSIGNLTRIGYGAFFYCAGGITIGENCQISRDVTIYSANHNFKSDVIPYNTSLIKEPVTIGNHVWIGMGARILPGVTVGDGAIIGMGAMITKDIPNLGIAVGNPAKVIGYRNEEKYTKSIQEELFFGKKFPNA
jgi:acetyltransferase-like isoleucine patch superfamily enzyme